MATKEAAVGQVDVFGKIHGLDKLVRSPEVLDSDGLKVIHFAISEKDRVYPGYVDEVKVKARKLVPEVRSRGKPIWMTSGYQTRLRKRKANAL